MLHPLTLGGFLSRMPSTQLNLQTDELQLQIGGSMHKKETKQSSFRILPTSVFPCPSSTCSLPFLSSPLSDMLVHPSPSSLPVLHLWLVRSQDKEHRCREQKRNGLSSWTGTLFFFQSFYLRTGAIFNCFTKRQPKYGDNKP